nr:hypothetical protein B0A51_05044 [Rachicladosporium sp. CCFEE 5018]
MSEETEWLEGVDGDFLVNKAVLRVMPVGSKVLVAERYGTSAWTKTGKITVRLPDNEEKRFFIKCITGKGARALAEGEYHSATAMCAAAPGLVPEPVGWGTYLADSRDCFFYLGEYRDLDLAAAPDPSAFGARVAEFHGNGTSPNGMFGFPVPTTIGIMERTVTWDAS